MQNISSSAISFSNIAKVDLFFDEKYEYTVSYAPSNLSNIVPLKSESFIWYSSVPYEIIETASSYKFKWEILSDIDSMKKQSGYFFSPLKKLLQHELSQNQLIQTSFMIASRKTQ